MSPLTPNLVKAQAELWNRTALSAAVPLGPDFWLWAWLAFQALRWDAAGRTRWGGCSGASLDFFVKEGGGNKGGNKGGSKCDITLTHEPLWVLLGVFWDIDPAVPGTR